MRPYRDTLLVADERVVLITRPHPFPYFGDSLVGCILIGLGVFGAWLVDSGAELPAAIDPGRRPLAALFLLAALYGLISVVAAWVRWRSREIVVTDRRVLRVSGILSKSVIDNGLDAITDLELHQSWLGRIFDFGDVNILTASDADTEAVSNPRETFPDVAGPIAFMQAVQREREARRTRPPTPRT